ncbi:MAG: NrdH-redoxin [Chloroflexi bacterium]|jgi:mycoredoxin|nr:NrdH-redoxin [Chloroflexota bacterium]
MRKITVYGTTWCGDTKRALRIMNERQIDFIWIDIDQDKDGEAFVKSTNQGNRSVPTIVFPDGGILVEPSNPKLIEKLDALGF